MECSKFYDILKDIKRILNTELSQNYFHFTPQLHYQTKWESEYTRLTAFMHTFLAPFHKESHIFEISSREFFPDIP